MIELLTILLVISITLNLIQLKKIKSLSKELREVRAGVTITREEIEMLKNRLEKLKKEIL